MSSMKELINAQDCLIDVLKAENNALKAAILVKNSENPAK